MTIYCDKAGTDVTRDVGSIEATTLSHNSRESISGLIESCPVDKFCTNPDCPFLKKRQ